MNIALSLVLVFAAFFLADLVAQTALVTAARGGDPGQAALSLAPSLAVTRFGMALAFVGFWLMVRYDQVERIWTFVLFWWVMLVLYEVGQALGSAYSIADALIGIGAATVALPLAGLTVSRLMRN